MIILFHDKSCLFKSKHAEFHMEYLYSADESAAFQVFVKSYGFSGSHEFCMRNEQIKENISNLKTLDDTLLGQCRIADIDSDAYISLEFENRDLKVYGQLGGSYNDNCMKFSFLADQTLIKLLIDALSEPLKQ